MPASVLLVHDQRAVLELMEAVLSDNALRVIPVSGATAALAALQRDPFAVVIVDASLPMVDGLALMRRARALPGGRAARYLLLAPAGDTLRCLAAGADGVIPKPLSGGALLGEVGRFIPLQRRAHLRVAARLPVAWKFDRLAGAGETRNLSLSGAFIRSGLDPRSGATGEILIDSAGEAYPLAAKVVRVSPGVGFAVEYLDPDLAMLDRFADDLEGRIIRASRT